MSAINMPYENVLIMFLNEDLTCSSYFYCIYLRFLFCVISYITTAHIKNYMISHKTKKATD